MTLQGVTMEDRIWHQHYDYSVQTSYRFPRIPDHFLLEIPSNAFPDKPAINYYGTEITFYELRELSLRMANAFSELGLKKEWSCVYCLFFMCMPILSVCTGPC